MIVVLLDKWAHKLDCSQVEKASEAIPEICLGLKTILFYTWKRNITRKKNKK